LRDRLRAATVEDHAALDAVGEWRLDEVSDYRAFLQASADAVAPLELALEASGVQAWLPDWSERARRKALISDLEPPWAWKWPAVPDPLADDRKAFGARACSMCWKARAWAPGAGPGRVRPARPALGLSSTRRG
jgi:heme oxygenase